MRKKEEKLGEIRKNKETLGGYEMKIIEYNKYSDIWIEFQDEYKVKIHTKYDEFKKGNIKNPYYPSVYGIGYLGQGKYKVSVNKKHTKAYTVWYSMLQRCYEPYYLNEHPTYRDCIVCKEWLCFQNFCEWFYKYYYECNGEKMCLDKDILIKGNKIYSPNTCIFVPERINSLIIKCDANRGKYPIGVNWHKATNKFSVQCRIVDKNNKKKQEYLGIYDTIEEAFKVYKNFKENYIKKIANEYKESIPKEVYDALYKYKVEIND